MEKSPTVAVLAGINGAGKTTASQTILREALRVPVFVNADTIARGLNAFAVESMAGKAGRIMLDHLHELAAARKDFAFETTLAARTYAPWLGKLRAGGYTVHLLYYWLDKPDLAVRRVADRVAAGGHDIPEETVRPERSELPRPVPPGGDDLAGVRQQLRAFGADRPQQQLLRHDRRPGPVGPLPAECER
ncbi:MAG: zeta toxin family protein [Gemmataceae bacterium]|nr:zeta toxin family protein [Gemmataceae bacterium]